MNVQLRPSAPADAASLLRIWRQAVHASHDFLSPEDLQSIEVAVADYVRSAPLLVAELEGQPAAFMGVTGQNIDSLFVSPDAQGRGIGRLLTDQVPRPTTVDVNEQNGLARAFYERLGFVVTGRSELDDEGRPYPLLHLRRD